MYNNIFKTFTDQCEGTVLNGLYLVQIGSLHYIESKEVFVPDENFIDGYVIINGQAREVFNCLDCNEHFFIINEDETTFILSSSIFDINGDLVCPKCNEESEYRMCSLCGCWTNNYETNVDGHNIVCEDCICGFSRCDTCGEWFDLENSDYVYAEEDDRFYCSLSCAEDDGYHICDDCGRVTRSIIFPRDSNYCYCDYCIEHHASTCDECNEWYEDRAINYDEYSGRNLCEDCWDSIRGRSIKNYLYKPTPTFLITDDEDIEEQEEFFGAEIEVAGDTDYADGFLEIMGDDEELLYLKSDSSVDGFEIVTHPMSRAFIYENFKDKLKEGMSYLKENDFSAHNKAGIHIHVSTKAITQEMYRKLLIMMYPRNKKVRNVWLAITQRKQYNMEHWSSMDLSRDRKREYYGLSKDREADDMYIKPIHSPRYTAMNCNNSNTVEFRIFNSNLRIERIMKNYEVIFALLDFVKTNKMPTLNNYFKFIFENRARYTYLADFLIEKDIYLPKQVKEETNRFLEENNITVKDLETMINTINFDNSARHVIRFENETEFAESEV